MYFYRRVFGFYIILDLQFKGLLFVSYFGCGLFILFFIVLLFCGVVFVF